MPSVIKCHSMPTGARQRIEPVGEVLLCTSEPVENEEWSLTRSGLGDRQFDVAQVDDPLVHAVMFAHVHRDGPVGAGYLVDQDPSPLSPAASVSCANNNMGNREQQ